MLSRPILVLLLLALPSVRFPGPESLAAQEEIEVFLVRHAERADDDPSEDLPAMDPSMRQDPPLSAAGQRRAELLARMLEDANLTRIYSTDYRRTRETASPLAQRTGLEVELYQGDDLEGLAERLLATPGRHLVVGHSNTTPELVRLLGGVPGPPIEALEYDRLYLVILRESGARTVVLRFGTPFSAGMPLLAHDSLERLAFPWLRTHFMAW